MKVKNGFTLAEALITIGMLGIVAAILVPVMNKIIPDSNITAFKQAYSVVSQAVSNMINDDDLYPSCRHLANSDGIIGPIGFNIPSAAILLTMVANTPNCTTGYVPDANTNKFCYLLSQQIRTRRGIPVSCSQSTDENGGPTSAGNTSFTSQNGMAWTIVSPAPQFPLNSTDYSTRIIVDVNGAMANSNDKIHGPDCSFVALSYNGYIRPACSASTVWPTNTNGKAPDIYDIGVRYDGNLQVNSADTAANTILFKPMKNTNSNNVN